MFVKDKDLVYREASDSLARMFGFERGEELTGKTDFDLFPENFAKKYREDDLSLIAGGESFRRFREQLQTKEGSIKISETSKHVIRDGAGEAVGICGISRDATVQVELELERERHRNSRRLFDCVIEGNVTRDTLLRLEGPEWISGRFSEENGSFREFLENFAECLIRRDQQEIFLSYYEKEKLQKQYFDKEYEFTHLTMIRMDSRVHRWVNCICRLYRSKVTDTLCITIFMKDVDEDVRSKQFLMEKAVTDALTSLNNRESVLEQISLCLKECGERSSHALLFIDLDGFKLVNDQLGHQYGDLVLQEFSGKLRNFFREDDIIGRIGGDEFLVFLRQIASREAVAERAAQIMKVLSTQYGRARIDVTCSVGIALCKNGSVGLEDLYQRADSAMYRAKKNGKNQIFFYEDM